MFESSRMDAYDTVNLSSLMNRDQTQKHCLRVIYQATCTNDHMLFSVICCAVIYTKEKKEEALESVIKKRQKKNLATSVVRLFISVSHRS